MYQSVLLLSGMPMDGSHLDIMIILSSKRTFKITEFDFVTWNDDEKFRFLTCNANIVRSIAQYLIAAHRSSR